MNLIYDIHFGVAAVLITMMILVFHKLQYNLDNQLNMRFRRMVVWLLITEAFDLLGTITMSYPQYVYPWINTVTNMLFFLAIAVLGYHLSCYVIDYAVEKEKVEILHKINRGFLITYGLSVFLNSWGKYYFFFDEQGSYVHGPFYRILCIFPLYYVLFASAVILLQHKRMERKMVFSMIIFMGLVVLGDILQMFLFPTILLNCFMCSLGVLTVLFSMETPDYQKLMQTMEELKISRQEADTANQTKSRFLAHVSHEIRTPINAVIGMNEMILRESHEENITVYAKDIQLSAKTLMEIINDILDMTKIESGKMKIISAEYETYHLLRDAVNMISVRAKAKGLQLQLNISPDLPRKLCGDEVHIFQVLSNILTNAVKYTSEGEIIFSVSCEHAGGNVGLTFSVKDSGCGIREEDMGKLFDAFERFDEEKNRNIEGAGLGLSITASLLKLMGSSLQVESVYGKGSIFSFVLWQTVIDATCMGDYEECRQRERREMREKGQHRPFTAPGKKILLVDDNELNRVVFKNLLNKTQIEIVDVDSGYKGLQEVCKQKFDLIFMDHMMPEMDGIETFQAFQFAADNKNLETPVIMLTANAEHGAREQYMKVGFKDFLSKPILPEKLEEMIRRYLND